MSWNAVKITKDILNIPLYAFVLYKELYVSFFFCFINHRALFKVKAILAKEE